jgi:hypothetical protein
MSPTDYKVVLADASPGETGLEVGRYGKSENQEPSAGPPPVKWYQSRRILIITAALVVVGLGLGIGLGLGLKKAKGTALDFPLIRPPVYASTPSALKPSSRRRLAFNSAADAGSQIKDRMYSAGPANYLSRLSSVDGSLAELKTRALESPKVCLTKAAQKFEPQLPNDESFPMYFSCKEVMNSQLTVYFGQSEGQNYLAELQKSDGANSPTMAVLAKIDSAGTKTDVWQIIVADTASPKTVSVIHIRADQTTSTNHVIVAATSNGLGVGCGVKLSASSTALWVYGDPADNNVGDTYQSSVQLCPTDGGYDTNTVPSSPVSATNTWATFCLNPSTLSSITSTLCDSLKSGYPLSSFSYAQLGSTSYADKAYTLITSPTMPAGLTDFKEVAK